MSSISDKPKWQQNVPDSWVREASQTKKYPLVLNGMQFCRSWTISDSFRDLVQNAVDSIYAVHKKTHKCKKPRVVLDKPPSTWNKNADIVAKIFIECEKGQRQGPVGYFVWTTPGETYAGPVVTIINLNAHFSPSALRIGTSTKGAGDAGGHGEGLKAAVTAAIRAEAAFEIFQSGVAIKFIHGGDSVDYKASSPVHKALQFKSLTKMLTKTLGVSSRDDVVVHVGNTPTLRFEDFQDAVQRFLFLTHRHPNSLEPDNFPVVNRKETKSGRALLLGEEFAGKVYAVGIYFKTNEGFQTLYGVDFIKSDAPCRDRNEISHREYLHAMGELISEILEADPEFAHVLLSEFKQAEYNPTLVQHLVKLPIRASDTAIKHLIQAYKNKPENAGIKYIVSGTSADHLTDAAIVPMWCDVRACRVVPPLLFDLISKGYPSIQEIKTETSERLEACALESEDTEQLRAWIRKRSEFFGESHLLQILIDHIEVRRTGGLLNVPYYIIKNNKIIFSQRILDLMQSNSLKFLDLLVTAVREAAEIYREQPPIQIKIRLIKKNENHWNFTSDFVVHDNLETNNKLDTDGAAVRQLEKELTESIPFGTHTILATPSGYDEWIRLTGEDLELLTTRSINACTKALSILTPVGCRLGFYVAPDSNFLGYAGEDIGIRINLRSVLLELAMGNVVEESTLQAYFDRLIAHEYAHYVHINDDHSPDHDRRTEANMQKLLQAAYSLAKLPSLG